MITNGDIINLVELVINHDTSGNAFKRLEYQLEINTQSLRLFNSKLPQIGTSKKVDQDLWAFFKTATKTVTSGIIDLTTENPAYIASFLPNPHLGRGFDEVTSGELSDRLTNSITAPTLLDPVSCRFENNKFEIYPTGILDVRVSYYKYPTPAVVVFTQNPTTLQPEYNAGASTEMEWSDSMKVEIAYQIIRDAGVNIERRDVTALADNIIKTGK